MAIKKKYKWGDVALTHLMLNKALEKHGVTVEDVKKNQDKIKEEHGLDWYQYYTFDTKEEYDAWKQFCINILLTKVAPKPDRKRVELEFSWFDLSFGLKQTYLTKS